MPISLTPADLRTSQQSQYSNQKSSLLIKLHEIRNKLYEKLVYGFEQQNSDKGATKELKRRIKALGDTITSIGKDELTLEQIEAVISQQQDRPYPEEESKGNESQKSANKEPTDPNIPHPEGGNNPSTDADSFWVSPVSDLKQKCTESGK